jgi:hypothetical protein
MPAIVGRVIRDAPFYIRLSRDGDDLEEAA